MPIQYITGDATAPQGQGPKVICHCVNDEGYWGAGFVLALRQAWPESEDAYRAWAAGSKDPEKIHEVTGPLELGHCQFVPVDEDLWVANLCGQHGINVTKQGRAPVRYDALQKGFQHVWRFAVGRDAVVHMPRMGAGLAGGRWDAVAPLVEKELCARGVPVVVYDLPKD
jgi:O-acetyl-ADP-ribose deacetylase (regulator of RNase III)